MNETSDHLNFEVAARHATRQVPLADPRQSPADVRAFEAKLKASILIAFFWVFDTLCFDPAYVSVPRATVVQDVLSIWIYLSIMTWVVS